MTAGRLIIPLSEPIFDQNGDLNPGATLTVYLTGTTTLAELYGNQALTSAIANPQVANQAGRFYEQSTLIFADASQGYDVTLTLTDGETFTYTNVALLALESGSGGYMPISGGIFTGPIYGPTASLNDNSSQYATTAYVQGNLEAYAPLVSPVFSGEPEVPTAAPGTNTTQAASTAFVEAAVAGGASTDKYCTVIVAGGVVTVENNVGFASVIRSGVGAYNFELTTAEADANYAILTSIAFGTSLVAMVNSSLKTTTAFAIQVLEPSNNDQQDPLQLYVLIKGS
jgi:hypothetical protein